MMTNHEPEARDLLETLPGVTDAQLRTLHDRLAASAAADGVLDVAYRTLDTPAGTLLLAATGRGLVRVAWASEDHDQVLETLATRLSPRILNAPTRLDPAARELDEYFAGAAPGVRPAAGLQPVRGVPPGRARLPDRHRRTAGRPATPWSRPRRAAPGRSARSARPAGPTPCPWWSRATG